MAYNFGLRLMSLSDTGNIEDLYNIVEANLKPLYDKNYYPVKDKDLFRDFVERLTDRYYSRYLNFNTYGEFFIKLKFVLENNRKKYQRIYELSLKEIDPLITYRDKETIKEDSTLTGKEHSSNSSEITSSASSSGGNSASSTSNSDGFNKLSFDKRKDTATLSFENRNDTNTLSFTNRKDKTEFIPTGKDKTSIKNVQAATSNPKTYNSIPDDLSDLKYIDNEQIGTSDTTSSFENRKDTTDLTKTGTEQNKLIKTGKEINGLEKTGTETTDYEDNSSSNTSNNYNDSSSSNSNSSGTSSGEKEDVKDSLITRIREGFSGNQMELLKMYQDLVFDLNNEIIEDINEAHLFMTTLA